MKRSFHFLLVPVSAAAVLQGAIVQANAFPFPDHSGMQAHADRGLFPKIHIPKVNLGKGAKALLYPVTKTTINGGKAVVNGGKSVVNGGSMAVKGAQKGVEIYEAGRALTSKARGIPGVPVLK